MTKKILFLGGAASQVPPIEYAKNKGYHVITCDYLPENPGHQLADEYFNISTTDKEAVLELAKKLNIDGIVAYASDPAAPTAAYVSEKMGLPGNPYYSVLTLARKDLFRKFLKDNDFNTPQSKSFYDLDEASDWIDKIGLPAFVKPVDSSGSKGVTEITTIGQLKDAFNYALSFSREKKVVVEQKIVRTGYQIDSDIFMSDGKVAFWIWGDQHQDVSCHPYAPVAISFPSVLSPALQETAKNAVENILTKLGFKTGAFNVEFVVDKDGEVWVIEIGPRNGGNLIPEVIKYASGVDTIAATVDESIGFSFSLDTTPTNEGFWSSYIVHAKEDGYLQDIQFSDRLKSCIVQKNIYAKKGSKVRKFSGSHDTLGMMILKFPDEDTMLEMLDNMDNDIYVKVT